MLIYYIDDIMLIRLDEQEVATMLETLVRHALQNMGDKPYKGSGLLGHLIQSKGQFVVSCISHHEEGSKNSGRPLRAMKEAYSTSGITVQAHTR